MKFNEVIGQEEAWQRLMLMVEEGRLPHALLLCGPMGCGKMALALAFASYLLGERPDGTAKTSSAIMIISFDIFILYEFIRNGYPDKQPW